jgi:hypothetical protein
MGKSIVSALCAVALVLFSGCKSKPPPVTTQIMLPTNVAGTYVPENEIESVRYGENVKAYTIGRYIDPNNTDTMYEKNIVYRVEESTTWNLAPNEPFSIPFRKHEENRQKLINAQRPLTAELEVEIGKQTDLRAKLVENNEAVKTQMSLMQQTAKNTEALIVTNTAIASKILEIENQVQPMRRMLDELRQARNIDAARLKRIEEIQDEHDKLLLAIERLKQGSVTQTPQTPVQTESVDGIPNSPTILPLAPPTGSPSSSLQTPGGFETR